MNDIPKYHNLFPGSSFSILVNVDTIINHFHAHRHNFIEIYIIISGHGKEIINGKEYELRKGSMTFLLPWHIHEIYSDNGNPLKLIRCNFGMELIMDGSNTQTGLMEIVYDHLYSSPSIQLPESKIDMFMRMFENMLAEYKHKNQWKEILMKAKVMEILVHFSRIRSAMLENAVPECYKIDDDIYDVLPFIHLNWNRDMTLEEITKKFNLSETQLDNFIKSHTGLKFSDYLNEVRIRHACALLSDTDLKISEISNIIGYKSIKTFYRVFRSFKGFSPEEFRQYYYSDEGKKDNIMLPSPLMWKIIYYIQLHFNEDIGLSDVAKEFHYSESTLSELFKRQTGQNFIDMLHEFRIYQACSVLSSTNMTVTDVGFAVGFKSSETFFRAFKKLRGMTPETYRKYLKSINGKEAVVYNYSPVKYTATQNM